MSGIIAQNAANSSGLIKAAAAGGAWTKIKTLTASSSSTLSFINGSSDVVLDSTYPIYVFEWINIHPASDDQSFLFQGTTDGSNFNINVTNTAFTANHNEAGDGNQLAYNAAYDSDDDTSFMVGGANVGSDNDQGVCGYLYLFNPSSTTFVKHYISRNHSYGATNYARSFFVSGYFNTTSAVTGMQFKFASANMDAGTFKLYGIKDS